MKTNALLTLVLLAVLVTRTSAASNQPEAPVYVLPTYVVKAPLYQPAEQKVNASLNELRQLARTPVLPALDLPLVRHAPAGPNLPKPVALDPKALQVAKL